jgi:hypothetical protein
VELSALVVMRLCQSPPYNFTKAACASHHNTQTYLIPQYMSGRGALTAGYLVSKLFRIASPGNRPKHLLLSRDPVASYEGTSPEFCLTAFGSAKQNSPTAYVVEHFSTNPLQKR